MKNLAELRAKGFCRQRKIDRCEALRLGVAYTELGSAGAVVRHSGRARCAVDKVLRELGLIEPPRALPRLADDEVARMYAHYEAHGSLNSVAREFHRDRRVVREIFVRRGLKLIHRAHMGERDPKTGRIMAGHLHTPAELEAFIARAKVVSIPPELRREWRTWPLARKAGFLRKMRAQIGSNRDAPTTSLSAGLEAFDYGSKRAHAIVRAANEGVPSRLWKVRIDARSEGVIYRGQLWFWCKKTGYQRGPWTAEGGRPCLHRAIWEETHGSKLTSNDIVVFLDGNRNNHAPANLGIKSRYQLVKENSQGWTKNNVWAIFYARHDRLFAELQSAVAGGVEPAITAAQAAYDALQKPEYSEARRKAVGAGTKAWWHGLTPKQRRELTRKRETTKRQRRHEKLGTALERMGA